jgi:hypothetical protein
VISGSAGMWNSTGRMRRFAKAAGNHRTDLKFTISGPFSIGNLVAVGCRVMAVGPRLGTLVVTPPDDANVCLVVTR